MPIYEYLCPKCNRIYEFMAATTHDDRSPRCPRCGGGNLVRQLTSFAFVRGGTNPLAAIPRRPGEGPAARDLAGPERDGGLYFLWDHCDSPR